MQVLLAGDHKFLLLELDPDFVANIAKQAGFEYKIEDTKRSLCLDLLAADRQAPLLLFDAADPGQSGLVLALPVLCRRTIRLRAANSHFGRQSEGSLRPHSAAFHPAPDRQGTARLVSSSRQTAGERADGLRRSPQPAECAFEYGVGVCGGPAVKPLAGRTETIGDAELN